VSDNQQIMIEALEQALVDARSGRLEAFGFAGIGHGNHVLCFAYDENRDGQQGLLMAGVQSLYFEIRKQLP
jgi:hypothetical protein